MSVPNAWIDRTLRSGRLPGVARPCRKRVRLPPPGRRPQSFCVVHRRGLPVPEASPPLDRLPDIDAATAAALVGAGKAVLVDVREPGEWVAGHAPEAVHIPLGELRADSVPGDLPVVAICRSGNRSGKAADALAAAGRPVHNVTGGMKAWAAAGQSVISDSGDPGTVA
ncbi:rhodanese-like domain-containing protein [Modestobacter muralis]|uniref:Rhodanese-like domain-containing protein n=1 Tax=Modestobacter muralis TaxID=1608614 RepID=A0A6P0H8C7_9ACTN|nr:rhodanese-like domain-containing protein [Modestobacter muralis]NEK95153.1 rhodanese-like domain-containing protein [Modestobacter muralis]NEN52041.1 rhodanese-like domain-containing protein [Modestobacter muralis]